MGKKTTGSEIKIDHDAYKLIVSDIETAVDDLLKGVLNTKMTTPGTKSVQEYLDAHTRIMKIVKKYKKQMNKLVTVMEKTEKRLSRIDQDAADAAANIEFIKV